MTAFEPVLENIALKEIIRDEILGHGRITFARYMELALYHQRHGYYRTRREKIGRGGDYLTSPEVHPIFGALIGKQLVEMWERLDRPERFDVVEVGGGTGALARDILRWAGREVPGWLGTLHYVIVELSDHMRARQAETLEDVGLPVDLITWQPDIPDSITGCILSNELLDSFPVHLVTLVRGRLREVYVTWEGEQFAEVVDYPSGPELLEYFDRLGLLPGEGARAEVNLEAARWLARVAKALERGFVFLLDYGYPAAELYAPWRKQGTLLCFYRHGYTSDPYAHVGYQDMTAHVDFTTVIEAGREQGLELLGFLSQSDFLHNLGISAALAPPAEGRDFEEYAARRRAVFELTEATGLGRIRILIQGKAVGIPALTGLFNSSTS